MIRKLLVGAFFAVSVVFSLQATTAALSPVTTPASTFAAADCPARLLTLPAWYRGLKDDASCNPKITALSDLWIIGLNIVEMMMHIVVYVASGFTMWGGFRYMIARGEPDKISSAKTTITHAITGLIISVVAVAAINFIVEAAL